MKDDVEREREEVCAVCSRTNANRSFTLIKFDFEQIEITFQNMSYNFSLQQCDFRFVAKHVKFGRLSRHSYKNNLIH